METSYNPMMGSTTTKHDVTKHREFDDVLLQNHEIISERVGGYYQKKSGLIARLFPGQFQKIINVGKLNEAGTELEFTNGLLRLSVQFKLDAIEEKYQTWLRVIKVNYREQFYGFVTSKVKALQETIYERETEFFDLMRRRYALIEKNKDMPNMVDLYRSKIEKEQETYFEWLEYIMNDFQNIVQEKINNYDRISNS